MHDQFTKRLSRAISDGGYCDSAVEALRDYMGENDGRHFLSNAPTDPNRIEPADLVAVTMLSMGISRGSSSGFTPAAAEAIDGARDELSGLLAELPVGTPLHELNEDEFNPIARRHGRTTTRNGAL